MMSDGAPRHCGSGWPESWSLRAMTRCPLRCRGRRVLKPRQGASCSSKRSGGSGNVNVRRMRTGSEARAAARHARFRRRAQPNSHPNQTDRSGGNQGTGSEARAAERRACLRRRAQPNSHPDRGDRPRSEGSSERKKLKGRRQPTTHLNNEGASGLGAPPEASAALGVLGRVRRPRLSEGRSAASAALGVKGRRGGRRARQR